MRIKNCRWQVEHGCSKYGKRGVNTFWMNTSSGCHIVCMILCSFHGHLLLKQRRQTLRNNCLSLWKRIFLVGLLESNGNEKWAVYAMMISWRRNHRSLGIFRSFLFVRCEFYCRIYRESDPLDPEMRFLLLFASSSLSLVLFPSKKFIPCSRSQSLSPFKEFIPSNTC